MNRPDDIPGRPQIEPGSVLIYVKLDEVLGIIAQQIEHYSKQNAAARVAGDEDEAWANVEYMQPLLALQQTLRGKYHHGPTSVPSAGGSE